MHTITVKGLASGKIIDTYTFTHAEQDLSIMAFLHKNGIPIASSCLGEGVCRKCVVNQTILSCQISLIDFCKSAVKPEISISYL